MTEVWDLSPSVRTEFGTLERVLVHSPGAEINTVVDPVAWNWEGLPRQKKVADEHERLVETLEDHGVVVHELGDVEERLAESLFVRDVAFAIEGGLCVGKMDGENRCGEERRMTERCVELGIPIYHTVHGSGIFEVGNVVWIDEETVAIGRSRTTNAEGIRQVRTLLETYGIEVVEVPIFGSTESTGQTHLALVFSMIDRDISLLYPPAVPDEFIDLLEDRGIEVIEVPMREQRNRVTSTVVLEPGSVILPAGNQTVSAELREQGVEVTELPIKETKKAGGGLKGLILPLERDPP